MHGKPVSILVIEEELLEGRPDIHKDYPTGDASRRNLVWNAASKTVSFKSARNEFAAFQLILETDAPVEDVDVRVPGLAGERGAQTIKAQIFKGHSRNRNTHR